ncbi:MAG: zinc-dependent metalloprotease, partial [Flavobacteriales bacterium]|nr:zinc-dependent metalloprotease [Flavobacteriales bacterium]
DYTDDNCMAMFSKGQVTRMRAALAGPRAALMFSDGCSGIANVDAPSLEKSLHLYPNPANDLLSIRWTGAIAEIQIINLQGSIQYKANLPGNIRHQINLEAMPAGYYFLRATIGGATTTRAFSINK